MPFHESLKKKRGTQQQQLDTEAAAGKRIRDCTTLAGVERPNASVLQGSPRLVCTIVKLCGHLLDHLNLHPDHPTPPPLCMREMMVENVHQQSLSIMRELQK